MYLLQLLLFCGGVTWQAQQLKRGKGGVDVHVRSNGLLAALHVCCLQDGRSFLHIPEYRDNSTVLRSVTLISGPCEAEAADTFLQPAASAALVPAAPPGGCNVRSVNNVTLLPTLLLDAAVPTDQPLLVFIIANVTLGQGLRAGAVDVRRPLLMTGLWGVPTSVDLGMVVNQLNVTSPNSKVFWQSLFLENAAPGEFGQQSGVAGVCWIRAAMGTAVGSSSSVASSWLSQGSQHSCKAQLCAAASAASGCNNSCVSFEQLACARAAACGA
jgi:hypothetical protein